MARARGIKQPHPLVPVSMATTRGIKQRHPLGSVRSRSGVTQLTAESGIVTSGLPGAKISELPAASAANDTDQFEVNQSGTSRRVTVTQLVAAVAAGNGTVTSTSVVSANGLAGTVATPTTTPAITLSTTVNGMVKGNGTALSAAVAGTDYLTAADVVTPSYPDNDTSIATTEYVTTAIAAIPLVGTLLAGNWNYNNTALVPPPASGRVRLSVAWPPTVGASIHLYIHNTDIDSLVYTWVLGPNVGDQLILRSASGARLDGIVTAKSSSTYLDVTITVTAVSGTLSNNSRCQIAAVQANYLPLAGGTLAGPGNLAVGGTLGVTGALAGTTATMSTAIAVGSNDTTVATTKFVKDQGYVTGGGIVREYIGSGSIGNINLFNLGAYKTFDIFFNLTVSTSATVAFQTAVGSSVTAGSGYYMFRHYGSGTTAAADAVSAQPYIALASGATGTVSGRITIPWIAAGSGVFQLWHHAGGNQVIVNGGFVCPTGDGFNFGVTAGNFTASSFVRVVGWP